MYTRKLCVRGGGVWGCALQTDKQPAAIFLDDNSIIFLRNKQWQKTFHMVSHPNIPAEYCITPTGALKYAS
jgi:hypothetical protein